ncbi:kinetochore scaffold 1 isoform X2 [Channa argus]|uniref:kinetochore scaffold 1 isoform X2 n=1 Tax=Channa argus TaxID=215402 RepID=UPI0035230E68
MEPQEPAKNDETSGFSKRRISSILKAPRKSAKFPEPEQQEQTVECAKPVEKRSSRRVSFAPANDVLLFSKDVKNASPVRSPLQELMTAMPTPKNRVQVAAAEDGIQPIMGMETLLKAPLHASQQRDRINFDTAVDFGEKTMMFSTDDAFMDMTHSHTINIASDADICLQDYELLPSNRERPMIKMIKTQMTDLEKENQLPTSASVLLDKSNTSKKVGEFPYGSAHCPEGDVSMDITEAQTGHILGPTDEDDPFQCLFPTQEMYSQFDNRVTQTTEIKSKQQQSSKTPSSSNPKATTENGIQKMIPKGGSQQIVDEPYLRNAVLHASQQKDTVNSDEQDQYREKTIMFTADDEFMDMTQSHTVNIAGDPLAPQQVVLDYLDPGFKEFLASLSRPTVALQDMHTQCEGQKREDMTLGLTSKPSSSNIGMEPTSKPSSKSDQVQRHQVKFGAEDEAALDVTQSHTGFEPRPRQYVDFLSISGEKTMRFSANDAGMDVTQSHTVNIVAFEPQSRQHVDLLHPCGEKTVRFTANDACMDVTRSHTVNIATNLEPVSNHLDSQPTCGEKTVRFSANDAAMDVTRSHTVNIDAAFELHSRPNTDLLPFCGEKTVRFTAIDAAMDVTQSHTVNIVTGFDPQPCQNVDVLPTCGEKTTRFTANDACMDVTRSHTVNIATNLEPVSNHLDSQPTCGEKTVRFSANDAAMDVTRSHTVNIDAAFELQSRQNTDLLPFCGEKTVRFSANDAAMDVTQSHTVNIATDLELASNQNLDPLPTCGEKTVRFSANDAAMDVTRSHTVSIATAFEPQSRQNTDLLPSCGEKTVRFAANDAGMDVTKCHTVNIVAALEPRTCQYVDVLPTCGEKTMRFAANDACMDVTRSHTVNIATNLELVSNQNVDIPAVFHPQPCKNVEETPTCGEKTDAAMDVTQSCTGNLESDYTLPDQESNFISTHRNLDVPLPVKKTEDGLCRNRSSSAAVLDPGFQNSLSKTSDSSVNPVITKAMAPVAASLQEDVCRSDCVDLKTQKPNVNIENKAPGFVQHSIEKSEHSVMTDCLENSACVDIPVAQTGSGLRQSCSDELSQCLPSERDLCPNLDHLKKTDASLQKSSKAPVSSNPDAVQIINHPDFIDTHETETRKEPELRNETALISQKVERSPTAADKDPDTLQSQKSRRMSLADLQSKIRRLSHIINTVPDTVVTDSCTVPLPQLDQDLDKNSKDKTTCLLKEEPELERGLVNAEDKTLTQCPKEAGQSATALTPFNLKTQLMSRFSVGGFKPKLPQRNKCDDTKRVGSVGEHTKTVTANITSQLSNFDNDVSNIYDEELDSCEEISETLDTRSPLNVIDKIGCSQEFNMDEPLKEFGSDEDFISASHGQKRPLPEDENNMEDEKRVKTSTETTSDTVKMELQSHDSECNGSITSAPTMTTQTTDHTASTRCEATFESTFKHSMFESQLEDYGNDVQKKLDDGTITVSEFFKLFSIDFVIHNPRQSVLPGMLLSDTGRTTMDLLKDRYINHPKQVVYETDVLNLTEKVEGLKVRMRDLDKPLRLVSRPLWEEMRNTSEKELKSFGAKLKERNNFFRKESKSRSHELKEVLYSNIMQANLREQQKLRGVIEKADEMIRTLDDCIHQLETELAEIEERGFDGKPSLKSCQEEMQVVTEALAVNDQKMCELELQKKQNSHNLNRVKAETRDLENHINILHTVNEWKLGKKKDNYTVYTFLYDTMNLHVALEKCNGNDSDKVSEHKISEISFKFLLNEEAKCNARLVHKLLSQYIEEGSEWVEKYPTSRHVPKLLHDVGLVVSRCRQLGEELRLLKMWGGLRLDILDICCVDTKVYIVFSSLKKFVKFEVVFSISLINQLYVLQLQSFKNKIGTTTIQQIEETMMSFSPGKKLLTKIVKKIHEDLLA